MDATAPLSTVAEPPPWERARQSWGLREGDAIAGGRTVLRRLGGGQRYEVFLVWDDHRLSVLVAKVLRPGHAGDPVSLRDLAGEAAALDRLRHPAVVRGFDAVLDGAMPHLLLEHLEGPTLRELLDRHGPLAPEQLLPLALHVAAALHYVAAEGMVHLDVKPENVVMGAPPRLIDLSVARTVEAAARLRSPLGTDAYMAPEQCDPARGTVGPAADVFGLAATLFHACSGQRPFVRAAGERFPQLARGPAGLPRRVPREFASLLRAALAPAAGDRPSAREFAVELEPLVAVLPRGRWSRD